MKKLINGIKRKLFGKNQIIAIEAALDGRAPDGGSWEEGKAVFESLLDEGKDVNTALEAALDGRAPDGGSWEEGKAVFYQTLDSQKKKTTQRNKKISLFAIPVMLAVLFVPGIAKVSAVNDTAASDSSVQISQTVEQLTATDQEPWKMVSSDNASGRWILEGVPEITNANTDEETALALLIWLDEIKPDPVKLAGACHYLLKEDIDPNTFISADGYATNEAIDKTAEMAALIVKENAVTKSEAPTNGYNSGVENGTIVQASGVNGNRVAAQVTLANSETVWVMARCGNPVTVDDTGLPSGVTDNQYTTVAAPAPCVLTPPVVTPPVVTPPIVTPPCKPEKPPCDKPDKPDKPPCDKPDKPEKPPCDKPDKPHKPDKPPVVTPPCDNPKSDDPNDYPHPGSGDGTTDNGTGIKPVVPEVTTPPETTPPEVVVEVPGGGDVIDTPTNDPGSESGITAPDADPVEVCPDPDSSVTPPTTIEPEPGVNPDDGGSNSDDNGSDVDNGESNSDNSGINETDPGNPFV